jgi:glycosyltransferase involved in cell wall biosynthesis
MEFGVVIPTYQRKDGRSPELLRRAIDSVFNQTHKNFKIFLIGDKYDDDSEFRSIVSSYDPDKIYSENLPFAAEREKYDDPKIIWNYGGCYANNYGIDKSISEGKYYICHLDHDDWWHENHLYEINQCISETNASFVFTTSTYGCPNTYLPVRNKVEKYIPFTPGPSRFIHSSVAMDFSKINLRHENVYERDGQIGLAGDGDFWNRVGEYVSANGLLSYHVNIITCRHDEEGYMKTI